MAAKAAPPKAEIDELLDERERQQRVDALVGRVRRDPTLLTSYTWKWRTSVAATHVLLGLVVYHALTRVIVAEARGMIDTIDVHALGLGDGDAGTYTWRQHLVACAQATAWATLLTLVLVAELTSACNALLGRHAWTPCAFHNILASTRMDATLAMLKTLAVLYLGWFTRTPTLATVFTPEAGDSNKLLVLAKAFHAAAAYFALVSIYRNTQVIRSEWSHVLKPKSQRPGSKAHTDTHVTGTAWAGLDSHGRYEKAAGLKQVREDVLGIVRAVSGLSIMPEDVMTQSGMDSLTGVELKHRLERVYGINLPTSAAFEYPTVSALATFVHSKCEQR
mmetsp:Transcript_12063/g.55973  ORF Transcript_12063/g.55973 Transcript_12063/m.55973 type:complete len:334 (-) Transcript_12063:70-1071(-)